MRPPISNPLHSEEQGCLSFVVEEGVEEGKGARHLGGGEGWGGGKGARRLGRAKRT